MSWVLDDSSSGISDVDLAIAMNDDSGNEEHIEYTYDQEKFDQIKPDPEFVNYGELAWGNRREEWVENDFVQDHDETPYFSIDVEETMVALHEYKPFPEPVRLDIMMEILQVLWEEDGF